MTGTKLPSADFAKRDDCPETHLRFNSNKVQRYQMSVTERIFAGSIEAAFTLPSLELIRDTAQREIRLGDQLERSRGDWLEGLSLPDWEMSLNAAFVTKLSARTNAS